MKKVVLLTMLASILLMGIGCDYITAPSKYNDKLVECDALYENYRLAFTNYEREVDRYNAVVDEFNQLNLLERALQWNKYKARLDMLEGNIRQAETKADRRLAEYQRCQAELDALAERL